MAATALRSPVEALTEEFTREADDIARVIAIATTPGYEGLAIWTLIEGDRDGTARRAIYDLELAVSERHPDARVTFSLLDAADYPTQVRRGLFPPGARICYIRPGLDSDAPSSPEGDGA